MEPPHPQPQLATQLRYDRTAGGREREQAAGRSHYGTTGHLPAAHGRARNGGGHGAVRFGPAHRRLSGVPEGDETDEGAGSPRGHPPQAAVPPRMYLSLVAWAVMAPLLVLGPQLGRYALEAPASLPPHQWQWMGVHMPPHVVKGAHLAQVSQKGIAKLNAMPVSVDPAGIGDAVKNAVSHTGGDNLLRTLSSPPTLRDGMFGDSLGPDHVGIQRTPYGTEIVRVGHTSIWNWGPFIFTLGVMVSILAKLLIAQPLAKMGTDLLLMWAGTQESKETSEEYYGYVYLERDEEFGGPSSQRAKSSPATGRAVSSTAASQAVTPRHSLGDSGSRPVSCDSKRSSSGRKKWPVTLDLPQHGAGFNSSLPQPAAQPVTASTPLPTLSPESGLTTPGESLISDLDLTPGA